jgi:phospholipase C
MAQVVLYSEPGFAGSSLTLEEGKTRLLDANSFNDMARSVRVPPGLCVMLYEHANEFGGYGAQVSLVADCADLGAIGFGAAASHATVFPRVRNNKHVWVPAFMRGAEHVPGHWQRARSDGRLPDAGPPVVGPPIPAPTQPQVDFSVIDRDPADPSGANGGVVVTDSDGNVISGGRVQPPPDMPPGGWGGNVRDHRCKVEHVFVLVLENRSFDHMLGFSGITGTDAESAQPTAIDGLSGEEWNSADNVAHRVVRGAPDVAPQDPPHGFAAVAEQLCGKGNLYRRGEPYPQITNAGFVTSYARKYPGNPPDGAMRCFTPEQVPVITALAKEFVVCDRWFCSMPGPTEPNRWFVHAATAGNFDNSPTWDEITEAISVPWGGFEFRHGSIFKRLSNNDVKWRIYACDEFPNVAELDGVSRTFDVDDYDDFLEDIADADYDAAYTFIEPSYDVFNHFEGGNSQHPLGSARAGEMLIKRTYEALRRSPLWEKSMLIVTYDEHGGFYDHVAPPACVATGETGRAYGFSFEQLGPRVPTLVISPLAERNVVDHRVYEHSSIPRTLMDLFHLGAYTPRANSVRGLTHVALRREARQDAPMTLPDPMGGAMARMVKRRIADTVAARPEAPIADDPHGNIAATLRSGLVQHLEVTPPEQHAAVRARVAALRTQGEALAYLKDVAALVEAARARRGVHRSPRVRGKQARLAEPVPA